jgi:hypothetical protein
VPQQQQQQQQQQIQSPVQLQQPQLSYDENFDNSTDILGSDVSSSPDKSFNLKNESLLANCKVKSASSSPVALIGTSGSLNPPPYRNPPAPSANKTSSNNNFPVQQINNNNNSNSSSNGQKLVDTSFNNNSNSNSSNSSNSNIVLPSNDDLLQSIQYKDLIQLIKLQRDKIINQQNDLTKVSCHFIICIA